MSKKKKKKKGSAFGKAFDAGWNASNEIARGGSRNLRSSYRVGERLYDRLRDRHVARNGGISEDADAGYSILSALAGLCVLIPRLCWTIVRAIVKMILKSI